MAVEDHQEKVNNNATTELEKTSCATTQPTSSESSCWHRWRKSYWSLVASISFLCTGLLRAYTSPALLSIQNEAEPNSSILSITSFFSSRNDIISWIASASPLASFVGTILSGPCLDLLGRRQTLFLLSLPAILGWLLVATAGSLFVLLIGRALTGLASGLATAAAPLYIAEINRADCPKKKKSWLGLLPGIMLSAGVLAGFLLAHLFQRTFHETVDTPSWRRLAFCIVLFPVALAILSWTIPESPLWLEIKKKKELETEGQFDLEMEQVVPSVRQRHPNNLSEKSELLSKKSSSARLLPVYIRACVLMVFQQFSGGNVLIYYLSEILTKNVAGEVSPEAGLTAPVPSPGSVHQASLIIGFVQFVGFFLALPLIDHKRVGRRSLLIWSGVLMSIAYFLLGFHFHSNHANLHPNPESLIGVRVTILSVLLACYSIGLGPIPFLFVDAEIFGMDNKTENPRNSAPIAADEQKKKMKKENKTRSYLSSVASLVNHLALFAVVKGFPYVFHLHYREYQYGPEMTFWALSAVCWMAAVFTFFCIPQVNPQRNKNDRNNESQ